jgi:hypothetical protein
MKREKPMKTALLFLGALGMVGCTESIPSSKAPSTATTLLQAPAPSTCALGVPGTRVLFGETPNGATLTFLTTPDRVAELQSRAHDAAALHGTGQQRGQGHGGMHGHGGQHGLQPMQMPPAYAGAQDIDGGSKITFAPVDKNDLQTLRERLHDRARAMTTSCDS